jgi:cobyrinic acid a,c-diamide synthase
VNGFFVGGTRSGVGKTIATLAICRALDREGYVVQPAKAGPDFIDPSHHERVAGRPSRTLDHWLQGPEGLRRNYGRGEGEVCVVEGMVGLYDGDVASTALVAEELDLPVVLVVDASAGMESVGATALGFHDYTTHAGRDIDVAGVIAGRAHGGRHERGVREALPDGIPCLGRIPLRDDLEVPGRHLGLHMSEESPIESDALDAASEHLDTDALLDLARTPPNPEVDPRPGSDRSVPVPERESRSPATGPSDSAIRRPSNGSASRQTCPFSRRPRMMTYPTVTASPSPAGIPSYTPTRWPKVQR